MLCLTLPLLKWWWTYFYNHHITVGAVDFAKLFALKTYLEIIMLPLLSGCCFVWNLTLPPTGIYSLFYITLGTCVKRAWNGKQINKCDTGIFFS